MGKKKSAAVAAHAASRKSTSAIEISAQQEAQIRNVLQVHHAQMLPDIGRMWTLVASCYLLRPTNSGLHLLLASSVSASIQSQCLSHGLDGALHFTYRPS